MTSFEKAEIRRLPKKYRPMGFFGYVWHTLLYIIPVLGFILMIWGACNDRNISRRSFARSFLFSGIFVAAIGLAYVMIVAALGYVDLGSLVTKVSDLIPEAVKKLIAKK